MYVILLIASRRRLSINMKQFFIGVWQFISYLFWPQKTDKSRYDA